MDYQSSQKGPTIIITQTPYTSEILRIDIPSLRDMPLVPLLYPTEDGKVYKSLTWKNEFAELSFNRFFKMNDLWEEKLGISRFTHIPIGNLTTDIVIEASDIFYGRLLTFNRHLLWASTSAFPDLGGYLMQNYIDSVYSGNGNNNNIITPFEQSNPGVYRSVCIELKIRNLIINTIRMSDHLSDMEDIETDDISQQFGFCDTAYNILRMLISRWISTAESTDLHLVDYFLGNCYRWLCSKSSLLYDPSIHSLICTLIKKVLLLILSEFRHLGASIIFASFDRIIFCSNKFTLESAKSYLQYILDTISNQELFKYLVFEPQIYWDSLIWMDNYNYGGIILENCVKEEEGEEVEEEENEENGKEVNENNDNNQEVMEIENINDDDENKEENENGNENEKEEEEEENEKENENKDEDEDDEINKIIEKHDKHKTRKERTQQYHDSDSDEDEDEEIENNNNGMEEEENENDYEDETLNGFIVDDEEIETSTGKIYRTEKGEANHTLKEKQTEQQSGGKDFSLHWLTATFLPAFLDAPFQVIIADFLLKPLNYRNELIKEHPESTFDEINEKMTEFTKVYIKEEVFSTLSKLVKNIHDKVIEDDPETKTDRSFPKFAGSYLNLNSPTLEYIKVICKILGLEECIDLEVFRLKTNLLSLIKKRESSEECQYKNPCLSLVVPDVICSYCNECQNIDFCRDSSFLFPVNQDNLWICEHCGHPYNILSIEYKLVELLDELISNYHYQDLRCIKCKNAKEDNLSSSCSCGGVYVNSEISSKQYNLLLTPFENIANYHQLNWLKEVINTYKH